MLKQSQSSGLVKEVYSICLELCGKEVADCASRFDDLDYPDEFIKSVVYFLSRLVDPAIVRNRFKQLIRKYEVEIE